MMEVMEGTSMELLNKVLVSTKRSLLKVSLIYLLSIHIVAFGFFYADLKFSMSGFTFAEFGCIQTRNSKVTCCHFSSDGKLLASAGHDKKVLATLLFISFHFPTFFPWC